MNGDTFIIWATEEGGYFHALRDTGWPWNGTRAQYDEAVATGVLRVLKSDVDAEQYQSHNLAFIAIGTITDNHDFKGGGSREAMAAM